MDIKFFSPENPFSTLEDEWELQNSNPNDAWQTVTALKKDGDFLRGSQYDGKRTLNLSFISKKVTGNFTLDIASGVKLACGVVAAVESLYFHVDTIAIGYTQNGQPTLDITAHAHLAGKGHGPTANGGDGGCRIYIPSLTFPALDIGCPTTLGDAFTLSAACQQSLRSIRYQLQVNHNDVPDRVGNHLAGDNYDGTETLAIEFTGEFENNDFTLGEGWFKDNQGTPAGNTSETTTTLNLTHHVAHYVAPANTGT